MDHSHSCNLDRDFSHGDASQDHHNENKLLLQVIEDVNHLKQKIDVISDKMIRDINIDNAVTRMHRPVPEKETLDNDPHEQNVSDVSIASVEEFIETINDVTPPLNLDVLTTQQDLLKLN